ncbi:MAG: hypothetical protein WA705_03980, partial [Candidatus Ozemobacteraceae bacterium]
MRRFSHCHLHLLLVIAFAIIMSAMSPFASAAVAGSNSASESVPLSSSSPGIAPLSEKPTVLSVRSSTLSSTASSAVFPDTGDDEAWTIAAERPLDQPYFGETVANGMIGLVSAPDPFKLSEVVLNGAYDTYGRGRVSNILKVFKFLNVQLDIDGRRIETARMKGFRQLLDLRRAELRSSFEVETQARIETSFVALRHLPFCGMLTVEIHALADIEIAPSAVMEAPEMLREVENSFQTIERPHAKLSLLTSTAKSPTQKLTIAASTCFGFREPPVLRPEVLHETWDSGMHLMRFRKKLRAGETYRFSLIGTVLSSANHEDPLNEAERLTLFAGLEETDRILRLHREAWEKLWQGDIRIEGDRTTQREVRSFLYHLYAFAREGSALSLSPMGLSGLGYNGHAFWDTELWMLPPLLVFHPALAESLLEYRIRRLDAARRNAASHGYRGAMFPWESAASGNEETPVWALSGPFEHHISSCISIALWKTFCVTRNERWLRDRAFPVLREIADFWVSRVERNGQGRYEIKNVVAADEWAENIDNDAFTNAAAKTALRNAGAAAALLGEKPDPAWEETARNIPIAKFEDGVTREHDSYRGEPIKQADVNLLAYPLNEIADEKEIRRDLAYYEPRVGEGPAMTHAIFALLHARLGEPDKALELFRQGYEPNRRPPFGVLAETATGNNPYFATGAGGLLQAMLFGFGGLEIGPQGLTQVSRPLPSGWKKLVITGVGPARS